jgi:prevent-host-death family protein
MSESPTTRPAGRRKPAAPRAGHTDTARSQTRGRVDMKHGLGPVSGTVPAGADVVLVAGQTVILNRRGQEAEQIPASKLRNRFGEALRKVLTNGAVTIVKHNEPQAVLLSLDQYAALAANAPRPLQDLTAEFDSLVAQMQTASSRKAARSLFTASPADFGKAALAAAKKRG